MHKATVGAIVYTNEELDADGNPILAQVRWTGVDEDGRCVELIFADGDRGSYDPYDLEIHQNVYDLMFTEDEGGGSLVLTEVVDDLDDDETAVFEDYSHRIGDIDPDFEDAAPPKAWQNIVRGKGSWANLGDPRPCGFRSVTWRWTPELP